MWSKLPVEADAEILRESGSRELFGEKGFTTLERLWARPTAEINGIGGGLTIHSTDDVDARIDQGAFHPSIAGQQALAGALSTAGFRP